MIFKPKRRACPGKKLKYPLSQHAPFDWLDFESDQFINFCVDGYIVDKNNQINSLFLKYELKRNTININKKDEVIDMLSKSFSKEISMCTKLAKVLNSTLNLFVWLENFPENQEEIHDPILQIHYYYKSTKLKRVDNYIKLRDLENGINKLRGFSFRNVKPLLSAGSNVECYLANYTKNPWPGDLDGLLYNKKRGVFEYIIEFKTHNIDSPIEKEHIGKYGDADWRRFKVLYNLQIQLEKKQIVKPKIAFIVWGTKSLSNHQNIKIDIIENNNVITTNIIPRPEFGSISEGMIKTLIAL